MATEPFQGGDTYGRHFITGSADRQIQAATGADSKQAKALGEQKAQRTLSGTDESALRSRWQLGERVLRRHRDGWRRNAGVSPRAFPFTGGCGACRKRQKGRMQGIETRHGNDEQIVNF